MSDPAFTVEDFDVALRLAHKLMGTANDAEGVCNEALDLEFTPGIGRALDTKIWMCADCNYWVPINEIRDDVCFSCRVVEVE